jgi:hypothetical protein
LIARPSGRTLIARDGDLEYHTISLTDLRACSAIPIETFFPNFRPVSCNVCPLPSSTVIETTADVRIRDKYHGGAIAQTTNARVCSAI